MSRLFRKKKVHTDIRDPKVICRREKSDEYDDTMDFFAKSKIVANLKDNTYDEYLKQKDVALVYFYDPEIPDCCFAKKHFGLAAKKTTRANHGYAAFNCMASDEATTFCQSKGIEWVPMYKMFSKGNYVATIRDYISFIADDMKKFVEKCPILEEPVADKKPCKSMPK